MIGRIRVNHINPGVDSRAEDTIQRQFHYDGREGWRTPRRRKPSVLIKRELAAADCFWHRMTQG